MRQSEQPEALTPEQVREVITRASEAGYFADLVTEYMKVAGHDSRLLDMFLAVCDAAKDLVGGAPIVPEQPFGRVVVWNVKEGYGVFVDDASRADMLGREGRVRRSAMPINTVLGLKEIS